MDVPWDALHKIPRPSVSGPVEWRGLNNQHAFTGSMSGVTEASISANEDKSVPRGGYNCDTVFGVDDGSTVRPCRYLHVEGHCCCESKYRYKEE
jgi:hypothetical protein